MSKCDNPSHQSNRMTNYTLSNFTTLSSSILSASQHTPDKLTEVIRSNHCLCNGRPSKLFLKHHSQTLEKVPISYFDHYCDVLFHVDGGANCGTVNDRRVASSISILTHIQI